MIGICNVLGCLCIKVILYIYQDSGRANCVGVTSDQGQVSEFRHK